MIFCLEADEGARELMIYTLNTAGCDAAGFATVRTLRKVLGTNIPDVIIFDENIRDEEPDEFIRSLKEEQSTCGVPVIFASAKIYDLPDADAYLKKPFTMMEMLSCVRSVLRKQGGDDVQPVLKVGKITMDVHSHRVEVAGREVTLTLKEYDLLHLMMAHVGKAFSRTMLLAAVWNGYEGQTRTVDVHVGTLRAKLGSEAHMLKTVRGIGYRLEN